MLKRFFYGLCALLLCSHFGVLNAQVLATVGTKKITLKQFKKKYKEVLKTTPNPPKPEVFLEDLVRFELGVLEAERKKLRQDPIVQDRFNQELYRVLVDRAIGNDVEKIKVTEKEMQAYYKKFPEIKTSHILFEFRANATPAQIKEVKTRALEILKRVKTSKRPFSKLVKIYTDDLISKTTGGDIGYQTRVSLFPTYYDTAVKLKVGQISGLVRTKFGFHIIKLTGIQKYKNANKNHIRTLVFDAKRKKIFDKFFVKLKTKYPTQKYKQRLKNLKL